jgi:hypothetical protein
LTTYQAKGATTRSFDAMSFAIASSSHATALARSSAHNTNTSLVALAQSAASLQQRSAARPSSGIHGKVGANVLLKARQNRGNAIATLSGFAHCQTTAEVTDALMQQLAHSWEDLTELSLHASSASRRLAQSQTSSQRSNSTAQIFVQSGKQLAQTSHYASNLGANGGAAVISLARGNLWTQARKALHKRATKPALTLCQPTSRTATATLRLATRQSSTNSLHGMSQRTSLIFQVTFQNRSQTLNLLSPLVLASLVRATSQTLSVHSDALAQISNSGTDSSSQLLASATTALSACSTSSKTSTQTSNASLQCLALVLAVTVKNSAQHSNLLIASVATTLISTTNQTLAVESDPFLHISNSAGNSTTQSLPHATRAIVVRTTRHQSRTQRSNAGFQGVTQTLSVTLKNGTERSNLLGELLSASIITAHSKLLSEGTNSKLQVSDALMNRSSKLLQNTSSAFVIRASSQTSAQSGNASLQRRTTSLATSFSTASAVSAVSASAILAALSASAILAASTTTSTAST